MKNSFFLICAALTFPLGSTAGADSTPQATTPGTGFELPTVEADMLVFEDDQHFSAVMSELIALQQLEDEAGGRPGDDREAPVFQDFANSLGFESLLISIETRDAYLDDESGGMIDFRTPEDHQIPDPYFRGVLNPQAEIRVGDTIYRYHPHGYYKLESDDPETLDLIRRGDAPEGTVGGPQFIAYPAHSHGCCKGLHSKVHRYSYAGGSRRMKAKQWVGNWGLYGSTGGRTTNQKRSWFFGIWRGSNADLIGVRGSQGLTDQFCGGPRHKFFQREGQGRKRIAEVTNFTFNTPSIQVWVKDYFDTTHWVQDNGGDRIETLSMCECREAEASFTLPQTSNSSATVSFDGSASEREDRYFIEVYRTDNYGSHNNLGEHWSRWFNGEAGSLNLANFTSFVDFNRGSGTWYRVRLVAQNGCTQGDEEVRWIRVNDASMHVQYRAHVKGDGWLSWVLDGATAGTTGQSRRMEAERIRLINAGSGVNICYSAHTAHVGWNAARCNGAMAGTTGQSRRMEATRIWLTGAPPGCSVEYRAHVAGIGWLNWVSNGAVAGTTGQSRRMEALEVKLVNCP